jgi:hypothetical protein
VHDNIMYSSCGGKTDTFPQLTVFDSLFLHNLSFGLYMNSSCGLAGQPACHGDSPHTAEAGSPFNMPDVAMSGVGRHQENFVSQTEFFAQAEAGTLPALAWCGRSLWFFFSQISLRLTIICQDRLGTHISTVRQCKKSSNEMTVFRMIPPEEACDHPCFDVAKVRNCPSSEIPF